MPNMEGFKKKLQKKEDTEKVLGVVNNAYFMIISGLKSGMDIGDYIVENHINLRNDIQDMCDRFIEEYVTEYDNSERYKEMTIRYIASFISIDISFHTGVESLIYYLSMYHISNNKEMSPADYLVDTTRQKYNSRHGLEHYKLSRRLKFI